VPSITAIGGTGQGIILPKGSSDGPDDLFRFELKNGHFETSKLDPVERERHANWFGE
jgi:hypothetical protein